MGGGKSSNSASKAEAKRQAQITAGTSAINKQFEGFNDDFYGARSADYSTWADPQLSKQYEDAQKKLTFALARQYGSLDTSEAAARQAQLAKDLALAKTTVSDSSKSYADQVRSDVEQQRNNLINQVQASADAGAASSGAIRAAEMLQGQTPQYQPLADFFANITEGLAAGAGPQGLIGQVTGLFKNPSPVGAAKGAQTIIR